MIRITKEGDVGKYRFSATCPVCGCEFDYELDDLEKDYDYSRCFTSLPPQYGYTRYVRCPCCKERIVHDSGSDGGGSNHPGMPRPSDRKTISDDRMFYVDLEHPNAVWSGLACEECPNRQYSTGDTPVVGDTPCTWCVRNTPYCATYSADGE